MTKKLLHDPNGFAYHQVEHEGKLYERYSDQMWFEVFSCGGRNRLMFIEPLEKRFQTL